MWMNIYAFKYSTCTLYAVLIWVFDIFCFQNILLRVEGDVYTAVVSDFGLAAKVPDPL